MKKLESIRPKKIAIFRALQLGDLLCAIPAVRSLKHAVPDSEITLIGLPWAETFCSRFSEYFSRFIHFPGYPGLPEQNYSTDSFMEFIKKVNREKFDLIIQLHGNGSIINPMIELLGAKTTAGYYEQGSFCADKNFFMTYPENISEIERHLSLMKFLGVPVKGKYLELPISEAEENEFKNLCTKFSLSPKKYVCLHPGARDMRRWWSAERFARIGDSISEKGYQVVLTGTNAEKENIKKTERLMKAPALNLVGKTDLGMLAALIRDAKMIFSNDTGVSHIAAAVKTPSLIVFLTSDPVRWAPLNKNLHHIILPEQSENMKLVIKKTEVLLINKNGILKKEKNNGGLKKVGEL